LYCGREGKPDDYANFIHCDFYDCDGELCSFSVTRYQYAIYQATLTN